MASNATLFAQFKNLQKLYLNGNNIEGFTSPKALQQLRQLQKLDLRDNSIADASHLCWGNVPALQSLYLSNNQLHGPFPKCLCEGQSLTTLILSQNKLNGILDTCLGNLTSLQHLSLSNNQFSGKFPSLLLQNLTNIRSLSISHNQFSDTISFSIFANLSKLIHLDISYNGDLAVDTESPTWFPSFSLVHLKLGGCNLNNGSARNVPSFLSTQHHLQSLDLSYNSLVGRIPDWLVCNISSELMIRGNNFSGLFTTQRNMSSQLAELDISDNHLYGPFSGDINLAFPKLRYLNASFNAFSSNLPQSLGEMKKLQTLDLSSNNLRGEIPKGIKHNMTSLEYLRLSDNNLEGEALPKNSSLPMMRWLYLDRNNFSGTFLDSISQSSSLLVLSIYGNDLSDDLSSSLPVLSELRILLLRENRFKGQIPPQLCHMQRLHVLDLSQNHLSGHIPNCLDNNSSWTQETFAGVDSPKLYPSPFVQFTIKKLLLVYSGPSVSIIRAIDFSSNELEGTIPPQVSQLIGIYSLNCSNNLLTGPIPASMGNMKPLESLDLSRNRLHGPLPTKLEELLFLSFFDVSFNNLSGPIPVGHQFATFSNDSYLGNVNLCGSPLVRRCDQLVAESGEKREGKNKGTAAFFMLECLLFFLVVVIY